MKDSKSWTAWNYVCLIGFPWYIFCVAIGIYLKKEYYLQTKRYIFQVYGLSDIQDVLLYAALPVLWIIVKNLSMLGSGKAIGMFTWLERYRYEPPKESHRKWRAQHPEIPKEYLSKVPDGLVLGKNGKDYVRFPVRKGNALSTIILGTPGSGKSALLLTSLIYAQNACLLSNSRDSRDRPTFFIMDCKPELLQKSTYPGNMNIKELNIDDRSKYGWDPFYRLEQDSSDDEILSELDVIARALIESPKDSRNEFFYESARGIFCSVAMAFFRQEKSFMEVVDSLMNTSMADVIKETLEYAEGKPELIKVSKGLSAYEGKEGEAFEGIELAFRQSLHVFVKDSTRFFFDGNPKKLSPMTLEDRVSIAFTFKTNQLEEYKTVLRLVVMQLLKHCEERDETKDNHFIHLILDECYRLGNMPWLSFLSTCRSKEVSCTLAFQGLSQMQSVWSREDADSLLEVVAAIAVLSCRSKATAEVIAGWAGEYDELQITENTGSDKSGSYSRSYKTKKIIEPADLMELQKSDEILLFLKGQYLRANLSKALYFNIPQLYQLSQRCSAAWIRHNNRRERTNGTRKQNKEGT